MPPVNKRPLARSNCCRVKLRASLCPWRRRPWRVGGAFFVAAVPPQPRQPTRGVSTRGVPTCMQVGVEGIHGCLRATTDMNRAGACGVDAAQVLVAQAAWTLSSAGPPAHVCVCVCVCVWLTNAADGTETTRPPRLARRRRTRQRHCKPGTVLRGARGASSAAMETPSPCVPCRRTDAQPYIALYMYVIYI